MKSKEIRQSDFPSTGKNMISYEFVDNQEPDNEQNEPVLNNSQF